MHVRVYRVWSRQIPFRVDIAGIIEIMGSSLYSRLETPIRELIQNAYDAILRRRARDLQFRGRIDIHQDAAAGTLTFTDDGVGLTSDEAEQYLGTLGIGMTGILKGRRSAAVKNTIAGDGEGLVGQFGIGLFSAFMLADFLKVESRSEDSDEGVCWEAGPGTEIRLSSSGRAQFGTSVTLHLKPQFRMWCESLESLEAAIREFADFLPVPIHVNDRPARVNVINAPWFEATPEPESLELALADYFNESPLDVIPIRMEHPLSIAGALYISPQRTPGFADESTVAVTVRRMVISRRVRDLLPAWGSFFRGILELEDGTPVASREDLVRDDNFRALRRTLEEHLYQHLEDLADQPGSRLESIVTWHRYHFAGAAFSEARLRFLLRRVYRFQTSRGPLLLDEILQQSAADPLYESDLESVVWYNADRRQERYLDELFSRINIPCVHAVRSFEESLLAEMLVDEDGGVELRQATPSARNFSRIVLGMTDPEDLAAGWQDYFSSTDARVMIASLASGPPVVAFLNDRYELVRTFEELRREGDIPTGFQRLIDAHFRQSPTGRNEVVLNRAHRLVQNALRSGVSSPLASVLRVLVMNALTAAGATRSAGAAAVQAEDLDWIADALRGPGA